MNGDLVAKLDHWSSVLALSMKQMKGQEQFARFGSWRIGTA